MEDRRLISEVISLYPLFWPKLYALLRSLILPVNEIEKILPAKGRILDVGCGFGFTSLYFALKNSNRFVVGSEISAKRITLAKRISKEVKNIAFKTSSLIEEKNEKFDAILAIDLLHHISHEQKKHFFKKASNNLSPNGLLIIKDIDKKPTFKYIWNYLHDSLMVKFAKLYFYSSDQHKNLILKSGFRIIKYGKFKNLLYPHIFYVCQKTS